MLGLAVALVKRGSAGWGGVTVLRGIASQEVNVGWNKNLSKYFEGRCELYMYRMVQCAVSRVLFLCSCGNVV